MNAVNQFELPNKMRNIEIAIQLEMKKGSNKNRELLVNLATQKNELKVAMGSLPQDTIISREDLLLKCDDLIVQLENAYIDALTDGSGSDASIDILLGKINTLRETLI